MKVWQQMNKREKAAINREKRQRRALVLELKDAPCADCKQMYPPEAMDFDHVPGRGGKLGPVGSRGSLQAIALEARRCDVVCANCHRVRTVQRRQSKALVKRERSQYLDGIVDAMERERDALKALRG